jgi:dienelactone hydrolase
MSPEIDLQALAARRIVYQIAGEPLRRTQTYRAADATLQPLDIYYPPRAAADSPLPAVVMITGYPDTGMLRIFGRHAKELGSNVSWAEAMAAAGLVVVTYVNVKPYDDAMNVLQHVSDHAAELGIDRSRLGVWSCSGNVPNALAVLMDSPDGRISCAALLYGYMLDFNGSTVVKDASKFGFVTPAAGRSTADMPAQVRLFLARAGLDEMPGLNRTIDAFAAAALENNLAITVVNHRDGPHAFDATHDSDETRRIIRQVLVFLTSHLLPQTGE